MRGMGMGMGFSTSGGGGSAFTHQPLVYLKTAGDSRDANSHGMARSGTPGLSTATWTSSRSLSNGGYGHANDVVNNIFLTGRFGDYGVGATTSQNLVERMNVANATSYAADWTNPLANPAEAITNIAGHVDANWSIQSTADHSPVSDPATAAFYADPINDTSGNSIYASKAVSLANIATIVDDFIANGGADPMFVTDSQPRCGGIAYWNEAKTVSGATCTATNVTGTFEDGADWLPVAVDSVWGDDPTLPTYNSSTKRLGVRKFTRVSSSPAKGEYTVNSSGVYTFNAAEPPVNVWITYFNRTGAATGTYKAIQYEFIHSSDANFVGSDTVDYAMPGLQYNRPEVVVIPQFDALTLSGTVGSSSAIGIQGTMDSLDLHHSAYGAHRVGVLAIKPTIEALYPSAVSLAREPTLNNYQVGNTSGAAGAQSGTMPAAQLAQLVALGVGNRNCKIRFMPSSGFYSALLDVVDGGGATGSFSGTYTNSSNTSTVTGTLTYATGVVSFTHSPTIPVNQRFYVELDSDNYLQNPLFDNVAGGVALPSGWTGGVLGPNGWAFSNATAVATAITNGTLAVDAAWQTDIEGRNQFFITVDGYIATAGSISLQQLINAVRLNVGDLLISGAHLEIGPGAGGSLVGLTGFGPSWTYISTAAGVILQTARDGTPSSEGNTTLAARVTGTTSLPFDNRSLVLEPNGRGGFSRYMLTPKMTTSGVPANNAATFSMSVSCNFNAGPVSFSIGFSAPHFGHYAD